MAILDYKEALIAVFGNKPDVIKVIKEVDPRVHCLEVDLASFLNTIAEDDRTKVGGNTLADWLNNLVADYGMRMEAKIAQLTEERDGAREDGAALAKEFNALQGRYDGFVAATAVRAEASRKSTAKDPDPFDGSEADSMKRHEEFDNWHQKIKIRWSQDSFEFPTEFKKILHIAGLLKGRAYASIKEGINVVIVNQASSEVWKWKTGDELLIELESKFVNIDFKTVATNNLAKLYQPGSFANYSDFVTEFTTLADKAGITDADRVRQLRMKISPALRRALGVQVVVPAENDFTGWLTFLQKLSSSQETSNLHAKMWEANNPRENHNSSGNKNNNQSNNGDKTGGAEQGGDPMDVDRVKVARVSAQEMARRMANGLCRRCGEAGHYAANCTLAQGQQGGPQVNRGGFGGGRGGYGGGRGGGYGGNQWQQRQPPAPAGRVGFQPRAPNGQFTTYGNSQYQRPAYSNYNSHQVRSVDTSDGASSAGTYEPRPCDPRVAHQQYYGFVEGEVTGDETQGKE